MAAVKVGNHVEAQEKRRGGVPVKVGMTLQGGRKFVAADKSLLGLPPQGLYLGA